MSFDIFTDSSANLTDNMIYSTGVNVMALEFLAGNKIYKSYVKGEKTDWKRFYTMLRQKTPLTTSCINEAYCTDSFCASLEKGKDVLYIAFSSALSGSYMAAKVAADSLSREYPERKIYVVDTLGASLGEGLLVYYASEMQKNGADIEKVKNWLENNKLKLCHWFTVDDLGYLFRGGRVTKSGYLAAGILNIKPVMHMDNEGKLTAVGKVMGRKKSIDALAEKLFDSIVEPQNQIIGITHGDCIEDAHYLMEKIAQKVQVKGFEINYVDPVVGAHSGPGTLALFFLGDKR